MEIIAIDPNCDYDSPNHDSFELFEETGLFNIIREDVEEEFDDEDEKEEEDTIVIDEDDKSEEEENEMNSSSITECDLAELLEPGGSSKKGKRTYRKSMSLPMSPVDRERLGSFNLDDHNLGDLLLSSPSKVMFDHDVDPVKNFEDISIKGDFNLINWVAQEEMAAKVVIRHSPKKKVLSQGKRLDIMRANHERQENLKKRRSCVERHSSGGYKRLNRGNVSETEDEEDDDHLSGSEQIDVVTVSPVISQKGKVVKIVKNDPNWVPKREELPKRVTKSSKAIDKLVLSVQPSTTVNSTKPIKPNPPASNLAEMKKKFLASIPIIKTNPVKKKTAVAKVGKRVEVLKQSDHDYCSPPRNHLPKSTTKSTILIKQVPELKKDKTPKRLTNPPVARGEQQLPESCKRVLNLDEYKKRRNHVETAEKSKGNESKYVDPISEAKNKALRVQERKRAAKQRLDEVNLTNVPLLPILPLEEMTGMKAAKTNDKEKTISDEKLRDYEEIVIVSMGCNTDLTIPASYISLSNDLSHQSTSLLSNLTSTVIKSQHPHACIVTNSLLFSIQDVMNKKVAPRNFGAQKSPTPGHSPPPQADSPGKPESASARGLKEQTANSVHGEDKVIMHLRKDRIRPKRRTISVQTDMCPEFPELIRHERRSRRGYHRSSSSSDSSSTSDSSDERCYKRARRFSSGSRNNRSRRHSRSPSYGRGRESRYRSRSRSRSRSSYHRRRRSDSSSSEASSASARSRSRESSSHSYQKKNVRRWNRKRSPGKNIS